MAPALRECLSPTVRDDARVLPVDQAGSCLLVWEKAVPGFRYFADRPRPTAFQASRSSYVVFLLAIARVNGRGKASRHITNSAT